MNCNCFLSFLIDIKDTLYYLVQAIVFYELAFHFNPQCAEACNNLGVIYKDRENLDKAVECYQVITIYFPSVDLPITTVFHCCDITSDHYHSFVMRYRWLCLLNRTSPSL